MPEDDYPVEFAPPDITPYKAGNSGIDFLTTFDSGAPGPHVMLWALVHGNEICGAIALDFFFRQGVRPKKGKLTLGFMNIGAYEAFDPGEPTASRFVGEGFNRLWSPEVLDGPRDSVELRRARKVRPLIETVDMLLDIQSMQHATAPLAMAGPLSKGRALARDVGVPAIVVSDGGHAAGTRLREYRGFGIDGGPKNALLVECGQPWEESSAEMAAESCLRFLLCLGVVEPDFAAPYLAGKEPAAQSFIEVTSPVTIETDQFRFADDFRGQEVIAEA